MKQQCEQRRKESCVVVAIPLKNNLLNFVYGMMKKDKICIVLIIFITLVLPTIIDHLMRNLQDFAVP